MISRNSFYALLVLFLLSFAATHVHAQAISDCKIDYKVDLNDPNMDPMAKMMMSGAKMSISFLGQKSRVDMNLNAMMRKLGISRKDI